MEKPKSVADDTGDGFGCAPSRVYPKEKTEEPVVPEHYSSTWKLPRGGDQPEPFVFDASSGAQPPQRRYFSNAARGFYTPAFHQVAAAPTWLQGKERKALPDDDGGDAVCVDDIEEVVNESGEDWV